MLTKPTTPGSSSVATPLSQPQPHPQPVYCVNGVCAAQPPTEPAPSHLNSDDCAHHLTCSSNLLSVEYDGPGREEKDAAAVRTDVPVPSAGLALYYFEARILNAGATGRIGIGLCAQDVRLEKMPGWEQNSYGYHGDDGCAFKTTGISGEKYGPKYGAGDVVGCCWDLVNCTVFFTRNGIMLGTAFRDIKGPLFPTVGMQTKGGRVAVNFGGSPYMFNIEDYAREQRDRVLGNALSTLLPGSNESISDAILGYMVHAGYARTARAFASDSGRHQTFDSSMASSSTAVVDNESSAGPTATSSKSPTSAGIPALLAANESGVSGKPEPVKTTPLGDICESRSLLSMEGIDERHHALTRVMSGDVCGAQQFAKTKFPGLCVDDPETNFLLKSQQFIELIVSGKQPLSEVLRYGREELYPLYDSFPERLQEVYSLLAYTDLANSPVAHLVALGRRELVADRLNRAILKSQGRPAHAVLERLVAQAQAVLKMHSEVVNGPASLIRGVDDFR